MLTYTLTVFQKILGMFIMIAAGYGCGKLNVVSEDGAKQMTSILFYIVTPCVILSSLQSTIGQLNLNHLLIAAVFSAAAMLISILIGTRFFRKSPDEIKKVLRFAAAYSNCGFVGLPLAQSVLGSKGTAYASVFVAVFNFFVWTHGLGLMRGSLSFNWKRAVLNPGMIGFAAGLPLFAASIHLPEVLLSPVNFLSDLNTPLAMIVVGSYISRIRLRELFCSPNLYGLSAVRLLLIPAVCLFCFAPFHADKTILSAALILSAAPSGANTVMFAAQFGGDVRLASRAVAVTTILSLLTMPLFLAASAAVIGH